MVRKLLRNPLSVAGTIIILITIFMTLAAPLLAPKDPVQIAIAQRLQPPSSEHWFGTDHLGRDIYSRVIYGSRISMRVALLACGLALFTGCFVGLVSGYFGGRLDRVLVLIMDSLFAFPYLLLAIVVAFLLDAYIGGGVATAALAITAVYVPQYFRVVRAATISAKEQTYVEAARAMGARPITIMFRYLLSNVVQSVPVIATLNAADAILTLAGLGFLGYGIQPTEAAEWGYDLHRAVTDAGAGIWWTGLFPGLAIVLLVMGLTLMGEGLNETMNPAIRVRRWTSRSCCASAASLMKFPHWHWGQAMYPSWRWWVHSALLPTRASILRLSIWTG
jgi:peptide/nickel transport system permease protein